LPSFTPILYLPSGYILPGYLPSFSNFFQIQIHNIRLLPGAQITSFLHHITFHITKCLTIFSDPGKKKSATHPTRNAQMIVPIPQIPPSIAPTSTNAKSVTTRTSPNRRCAFSLIATATRSFGPVPASDSITMVMPDARIAQPSARIRILIFLSKDISEHSKMSIYCHSGTSLEYTVFDNYIIDSYATIFTKRSFLHQNIFTIIHFNILPTDIVLKLLGTWPLSYKGELS